MAKPNPLRDLKASVVKARVQDLLSRRVGDIELRNELEELSAARAFAGFTWLWGPPLYHRNKAVFRPLILSNFSRKLQEGDWSSKPQEWRGERAEQLEGWLAEVERQQDAELFQELYAWKHSNGGRGDIDAQQWRGDLMQRVQRAASAADRQQVLRMMDVEKAELNERAARELYRLERTATAPFILRHLPYHRSEERKLWRGLVDDARQAGDEAFAFQLYRRQVDFETWEQDVLNVAQRVAEPGELCRQLELRHPEGIDSELGIGLYQLVERRGRDVLPYVQKHLSSVYRRAWGDPGSYRKLVKLAAANGWWDLWSSLVRSCAPDDEFQNHVQSLVRDDQQDAEVVRHRLLLLTGASREWHCNPFSTDKVQQLDDETAWLLYGRFPDLVRGPFKLHIAAVYYGTGDRLMDQLLEEDDQPLIDYLASRLVTCMESPFRRGGEQVARAKKLARYYQQFRQDDAEFSRRAVAVLAQVPARRWSYAPVMRTNRLARMFYRRAPEKYLAYPDGIRELLESPEVHAQALAFRVLALDDGRARTLAQQNLDVLQSALLRPLQRSARLLAFRALENAVHDAETAAHVIRRCREALDLPDKHYPKEALVGLLGRLLHAWPACRTTREQPLVYGDAR